VGCSAKLQHRYDFDGIFLIFKDVLLRNPSWFSNGFLAQTVNEPVELT